MSRTQVRGRGYGVNCRYRISGDGNGIETRTSAAIITYHCIGRISRRRHNAH